MKKWLTSLLACCVVIAGLGVPARADDGTPPSYGTVISFADMEVTEATKGTRYMPASELGTKVGALLFRNDAAAGERLTVTFAVDRADEYEVDLQAYRATSYGTYDVSIDGEAVGSRDFYAESNGPGDFEALATVELDQGPHQLTFESTGKHDSSSGHFMAPMQVMLLDEEDRKARYQELVERIDAARENLGQISGAIPDGSATEDVALRDRSATIMDQLEALAKKAADVKDDSAALAEVSADVDAAVLQVKRFDLSIMGRNDQPEGAFGLSTADTMGFVYPRELPCETCTTEPTELSLAQGEYESVQAVVMPYGEDLTDVRAQVAGVEGPDGKPVKTSTFRGSVDPLGSVFVRNTPAVLPALGDRPENYEGWIPDPVRTDLDAVGVKAWDLQPFWVELLADEDAEPGRYTVSVQVSSLGNAPQTLEIEAQVWPFSIPERPDLATSITTKSTDPFAQPKFSERWRILEEVYDPDAEEFAALERKYIDLLETFKIEPDLIYNVKPPTVAELRTIEEKWGLRQFNVLYLPPYGVEFDPEDPDSWQPEIDKIIKTVETAMTEYEKAGLADKAYIYGFDESSQVDLAKEVFRQIKQKFPDLPIMSTYLDSSLGEESGLAGLVDIWVPGVEHYDADARARAQARGDQVYWYTHQAVRDPLPNWFNGYAPSDTRVLLGPMSHQQQIDGFLYYNIARWVDRGPMDDGVLSDWDPQTYPTANGDGSLFYPGPDGPLSSQRMHNFRDGMEDFNLLNVLEKSIERAEDAGVPADVLAEARTVLDSEMVVTSEREYTKDAANYRAWRDSVANMIIELTTANVVKAQLMAYVDDGKIDSPVDHQLTRDLDLAIRHHASGRDQAAQSALDRFVRRIRSHESAVDQAAADRLLADAQLLSANWTE